jgi:hypothetical protein
VKYQIGPGPELLKEIGQVMVNYSECERSIHDIFRSVMSLDEHQMHLLVSKANLNSEKMIPVIKIELHRVRPAILHESILQALGDFTKSIPERNAVAHWQWAVTEGEEGMATNSLRAKPGQPVERRDFALKDLEKISWKVARAAMLLSNAATLMHLISRQSLADGNWARDRYEPDAELRDQMIQHAIDVTQRHIKAYEAEHFQSEPSPSSDTSQQ